MRARILLFILLAAVASAEDDELAAIRDGERAVEELKLAAARHREDAHHAIDEGAYDRCTAAVSSLAAAERAIAHRRVELRSLATRAVERRVALLGSPRFEERQRATDEIAALGSHARAAIDAALAGPAARDDPEVRQRLNDLREKLKVRQWAARATASSEYSSPAWAASQATGAPDTDQAGDQQTAWASREPDAGEEWLELDYDERVAPTRVRVRETFNPGAVVRIEGRDAADEPWRLLWAGRDATTECPGWLEISPGDAVGVVRSLRIVLDTSLVPGWNEIDAVELIGLPAEER